MKRAWFLLVSGLGLAACGGRSDHRAATTCWKWTCTSRRALGTCPEQGCRGNGNGIVRPNRDRSGISRCGRGQPGHGSPAPAKEVQGSLRQQRRVRVRLVRPGPPRGRSAPSTAWARRTARTAGAARSTRWPGPTSSTSASSWPPLCATPARKTSLQEPFASLKNHCLFVRSHGALLRHGVHHQYGLPRRLTVAWKSRWTTARPPSSVSRTPGIASVARTCTEKPRTVSCTTTGARAPARVRACKVAGSPVPPRRGQETCNNVDDDCNGATDDGLGDTTCGLGLCKHTVTGCVNGVQGVCNPFEGASAENATT